VNPRPPRFVIPDLIRDPCARSSAAPFGLSLACPELVGGSKSSLPSTFVVCQQAGGSPAATHFLLRRQKKVSKEKATLLSASLRFAPGNLRCSVQPGSSSNSLRSNNRSPSSVWTSAPRRIQKGGGCGNGSGFGYAIGLRQGRALRVLASPHPHSLPPPVGLGRGAQAKADQGSRLSEPKASSSETPLLPSTAGCLERSGRTQTIGSPFFSLGFFGEAKKSKSPAGASPGLREALSACTLAKASTSSARTVERTTPGQQAFKQAPSSGQPRRADR
jgi:hypothetical protein